MIPLKDFKNWFKMFPPNSATSEEWELFDQNCKTKFPIRYWLNESLIPNTWDHVKNSFSTFKDMLNHYLIERLHIIDTKLPPGYYDLGTRLLYGLFALLVDYVEIECAWMNKVSERGLEEKRPWWKKEPRFKRSREKGLEYLDWEINLKNEKSKDIGEKSINKDQSEAAQIAKELYLWWVDERPKREDPYKMMDDPTFVKGNSLKDWLNKDDPKRDESIKKMYEKEIQQDEEDTQMLIKLVQLRKSLWT